MRDYIIVSDGTIDLDKKTVESLDIKVIPMIYIMDGSECFFDPSKSDFDDMDFYSKVNSGVPVSTSQNPPDVFTEYFLNIAKEYDKILYICFSSGLSGNYNSALLSAESVMSGNKRVTIKVIDSLCASVGEGFLVRELCRKRDEGMSFEELALYAEKIKRDVCHWFVVGNLQQLRRGGRINAFEARLGTLLNVHPIITTDDEGKLRISEKVRGMKKAIKTLVERFCRYAENNIRHRIIVAHAGCLELAENLKKLVMETGRIEDCVVQKIGPVIGAHTGSPMCAIVFLGKQEK